MVTEIIKLLIPLIASSAPFLTKLLTSKAKSTKTSLLAFLSHEFGVQDPSELPKRIQEDAQSETKLANIDFSLKINFSQVQKHPDTN